ncbi:hypothetical protein J1G36_27495 [Pseudomonas carnis]|uniref:hypothetical protein n=1 Tax=Pseudomonas TaxID=286 RepID=UPI000F55CF1E|nr:MULTISPECIES: hypothetical protein [Pseudomonas]AZC90089.1 Oxygen-regulated invasion protein OrgA [Pseudomonas chlororaphis subsp. piscium]MBY8955626.1 hypothetical protein [Pseudomonas carnis]
MLRLNDALLTILNLPLDYLHPHRGLVPPLLDGPEMRAVINQALLTGLGLSCPEPQQMARNAWTDLWILNWQHLPVVARLMGAQLMWPQLARGARMRELDSTARAFARIDLGPRVLVNIPEEAELELSTGALGLAALTAWKLHIPEALMQRLPLQFCPRVVELQHTLPLQPQNSSLFIMAVQHARIHQNPC